MHGQERRTDVDDIFVEVVNMRPRHLRQRPDQRRVDCRLAKKHASPIQIRLALDDRILDYETRKPSLRIFSENGRLFGNRKVARLELVLSTKRPIRKCCRQWMATRQDRRARSAVERLGL